MKVDVRDYVKIETALSGRLEKAWKPLFAQTYRSMVAKVAEGDFDGARKIAESLDFSAVAKKSSEYAKYMLWNAAVFGAKTAAQRKSPVVALAGHEALLTRVTKTFAATIQKNVTTQVKKAALQSIAAAEETYKGVQKAESKKRFVKDFVSFKETGDGMLQLVASLNTSRLAVWGFTAEASVRGITTYKLEAVLDGRTSKFCQFINGRTFEVASARTFINKVLSADDPEDLRTLAPWPNQSIASLAEYKTLTTAELRDRGYFVPPFHPGCRTLCVPAGVDVVSAVTPSQSFPIQSDVVTAETAFEGYGLVTEKQLSYWNRVFKTSPTYVMARLTGATPSDLLEMKFGKSVKFNEDGTLTFKYQGAVNGVKTKLNQVLDPFEGKLYTTAAEFEAVTVAQSAATARELLKNAIGLSNENGLTVALNASGAAYAFGTAGFLPDYGDWQTMRAEALKRLENLTLKGSDAITLKLVLQSNDPAALRSLVALPIKIDGQPAAKVLLKGLNGEMTLDTLDGLSMEIFNEWSLT